MPWLLLYAPAGVNGGKLDGRCSQCDADTTEHVMVCCYLSNRRIELTGPARYSPQIFSSTFNGIRRE